MIIFIDIGSFRTHIYLFSGLILTFSVKDNLLLVEKYENCSDRLQGMFMATENRISSRFLHTVELQWLEY